MDLNDYTWWDRKIQTSLIFNRELLLLKQAIIDNQPEKIKHIFLNLTIRMFEDATWINNVFKVNRSINIVHEDVKRLIPMLMVLAKEYNSLSKTILIGELSLPQKKKSEILINKVGILSKRQKILKQKIISELDGIENLYKRISNLISPHNKCYYEEMTNIQNRVFMLQYTVDEQNRVLLCNEKSDLVVDRLLLENNACCKFYEDTLKLIISIEKIIIYLYRVIDKKSDNSPLQKNIMLNNESVDEVFNISSDIKSKAHKLNLIEDILIRMKFI